VRWCCGSVLSQRWRGSVGGGGSGVRWRVGESSVDDWIDRSEGNKFGFAGKSSPEKFSGGGSVVAAVAAAGGRWPVGVDSGERREGYNQNQGQNFYQNQAPNQSFMDDLIRQYIMKQETLNLNHETRFQNQEATLQLMQNQMGQMVKILQERPLGVLPSNIVPNPREQINLITTKSGLTTAEHSIPPHVPPTLMEELEKEPETLMDEVYITSPASTAHVSPPGIQLVSPPKPNLMDALTQIPKYTKVLKDLLKDKEKLEELANTLINVECSAILLNKVLEKLGDPKKFLISYVLQDLEVCSSLFDSGGSINHMPLLIYEKLRIGPLKPTRMTLELANRCVTYPMGIAEDVIVNVDKFNFLADFIIVDFEDDPRVPIILRRPFLRIAKALVDLYEEKLTLRIGMKKISNQNKQSSGSITSHSDLSLPDYESFCFDVDHQEEKSSGSTTSRSDHSLPDYEAFCFDIDHHEEKSSGSTTSRSDHSLPDYEAFCFDIDHHEEKSSGSTTSYSDPSLLEYESFYFDLSIDPLPSAERSDSHHEEFADELAHIISPSEYDHFYFDIEVDPGELTRLLIENSSSNNVNLTEIKEDNELKPKTSTKKLTIHELNDLRLLLSNCDSTFSKEFFEIDFLVAFPSENKDKIFDLEIFIIKGDYSKRSHILPLNDVSPISFVSDLLLTNPSEIETFLSFPFGNKDKVFDPVILLIDGVLSFTIKTPHLLSDNFKIDKRHIWSEISLKIISSVSFLPRDKEIRGESS
nr:hypothetical protein [Tanacetum cinerariifolium]